MKKIILCFIAFFLISCEERTKPFSIAVDKNWYSLALNGEEANLNGFIQDILLEISKEKKVSFELIETNWDDIILDLKKKKYQAIFSSLEPYNFNKAKFEFSKDIIKTGFVLITAAEYKSLKDMSNKHVGYISDSGSQIFLQKYGDIFEEAYISIPAMLDDILKGNIEGAILSIIPANKYVSDLYQNELKIVEPPLNDQAIRLVTLKDQNQELLNLFNSAINKMEKKGELERLKVKWSLPH